MADQAGSSGYSALCLRLMQLFPRVTRGMRRWQDRAAPVPSPLSPRHVAALEQVRGGPLTVGELASRLDLTLPTVSGVLADLDRAGLVERRSDPAVSSCATLPTRTRRSPQARHEVAAGLRAMKTNSRPGRPGASRTSVSS